MPASQAIKSQPSWAPQAWPSALTASAVFKKELADTTAGQQGIPSVRSGLRPK